MLYNCVYTADDQLIEGDVEEGRRCTEDNFNRVIEIKEREQYRVKLFMDAIDQRQKTIVFSSIASGVGSAASYRPASGARQSRRFG